MESDELSAKEEVMRHTNHEEEVKPVAAPEVYKPWARDTTKPTTLADLDGHLTNIEARFTSLEARLAALEAHSKRG